MICAINEENSDCRILEEISAFVINYIYSGLYDFYSSHEFVFGYNKRNRKEQIQKNNENKLKIDIEKEQVMDRKSVLEVGKVLYRSGLPFRVRLFNILASLGFIISLCNGVLSYWNNGDRKLLLINTGIALLSLSLLFYAYHSKKYQRCYFWYAPFQVDS